MRCTTAVICASADDSNAGFGFGIFTNIHFIRKVSRFLDTAYSLLDFCGCNRAGEEKKFSEGAIPGNKF
jgi:hypothetical protein